MARNKTAELLNYINKPMNRETISVIYANNKIKKDKCEIFNDFIQSLLKLIFDTYMGDDITDKFEQKNHFKWCWDKNVQNFAEKNIIIGDEASYKYFIEFAFDVYYPTTRKDNPQLTSKLLNIWGFIFNTANVKSKSDVDTFIEVYKLLDASLKLGTV
jgi:hypothetical protein